MNRVEVEAVVAKIFKRLAYSSLVLAIGLTILGCSTNDQFKTNQTQQFFTQSYNPAELDVLWVIDNRTDLTRKSSMVSHLTSEAQTFFTRLDNLTSADYQMAIIDVDATASVAGELQPTSDPLILTKGVGDVTSRTALFGDIIGSVINLSVSALNQGLANTLVALQTTFIPRANVPLVLVWISDSDDASTLPSGVTTSKVQYFANQILSIKGNNPDLVRAYSVNYLSSSDTCATESNIVPDQSFTPLALLLNGTAADLCGSFGSTIDLTGLTQNTPQTVFALNATPDQSSIQISIFDSQNNSYPVPSWTYNATNNTIVFATAPAAGTTIEVTFNQI